MKCKIMKWFGQVPRMNLDTQAREAFKEALTDHKKKPGRPFVICLKKLEEDLKPVINVKLQNKKLVKELEKMAVDLDNWKELTKNIMMLQY